MTTVDTHCHIGLHKYEPVESLIYHMERTGVDKAVFIQYMGNADNSYIVECLEKHPGRFSAAMIVDDADDGSKMREWAEKGIGGIRLPAGARSSGPVPLAQWQTAEALGLVVSAPCSPGALLSDAFSQVLKAVPDLQIVIEHLAGVGHGAEPPYDEYRRALQLADHPNLTIKLPGFGEFCQLPHPFADIPPLVDMALEAFGPERMMWGSDYPPVSSREGYNSALERPMAYLSGLSQDEREWIFGRTALRVWRFAAA